MNILAEMKSTLGLNDCKLLCINSSTEADGADAENSWLPYKSHGLHNQDGACWLNTDDLNEVLPHLMNIMSSAYPSSWAY
jgi:hypothetical protein